MAPGYWRRNLRRIAGYRTIGDLERSRRKMNQTMGDLFSDQNAGPYSESQVMARDNDGRYAATDLAW